MIVGVVVLVILCVAVGAVAVPTQRQERGRPARSLGHSHHHVGFDGEPISEADADHLDRVTIVLLRMYSL